MMNANYRDDDDYFYESERRKGFDGSIGDDRGGRMVQRSRRRRSPYDDEDDFDDDVYFDDDDADVYDVEPRRRRGRDTDDLFQGEGGNYWVNPQRSLDRYPSSTVSSVRRRRREGRNGEDWFETKRNYDEDEFDEDWNSESYREYGTPPPTRSR